MVEKIEPHNLEIKFERQKRHSFIDKLRDLFAPKGLDKKYFAEQDEIKLLFDWVNKLHPRLRLHIPLISREEWTKRNENEKRTRGQGRAMIDGDILYLPEDLHIGELAGIIRHINKTTFGDVPPEDAASHRLGSDLRKIINTLLSRLKGCQNKNESKNFERAIKKYVVLYESLGIGNFCVNENEIDTSIDQDLDKIERGVSKKMTKSMLESFLELSIKSIPKKLPFFDKAEFVARSGGDKSIIQQFKKTVGDQEKDLYTSLDMDGVKKTLFDSSHTNKEKKTKQQKEAIEKMLTAVRLYSGDVPEGNLAGSEPALFLYSKHMKCIGKTMTMHGLLQEISIKHFAMHFPTHIALGVILADGSEWYCDPSYNTKLVSLSNQKTIQTGAYTQDQNIEKAVEKHKGFPPIYTKSEVEDGIMADFLNVWGSKLSNTGHQEEALEKYQFALRFGVVNADIYANIATAFERLNNYEQAREWALRGHQSTPSQAFYLEQLIRCEEKLGNIKAVQEGRGKLRILKGDK